jgi:hypothetical protein
MFDGAPEPINLCIRLIPDQMFITGETADRVQQDHCVIERQIRAEAVSTSGAFVSAGPLFFGPGASHRLDQTGVLRFGSIHRA